MAKKYYTSWCSNLLGITRNAYFGNRFFNCRWNGLLIHFRFRRSWLGNYELDQRSLMDTSFNYLGDSFYRGNKPNYQLALRSFFQCFNAWTNIWLLVKYSNNTYWMGSWRQFYMGGIDQTVLLDYSVFLCKFFLKCMDKWHQTALSWSK